jgi:nitrogen fixation protein FixH
MTAIDLPRTGRPSTRGRLTGWKFLAILLGVFGVVASANGIMIYYAISTFPGVIDDHAYEHGISYGRDIASAQAQDKLGWKVDGKVTRLLGGKAEFAITIRDDAGAVVTGLQVAAILEFQPDRRRDLNLQLSEVGPGQYKAEALASAGAWMLDVAASRDGAVAYRSRNRLMLQ